MTETLKMEGGYLRRYSDNTTDWTYRGIDTGRQKKFLSHPKRLDWLRGPPILLAIRTRGKATGRKGTPSSP
jgi:hypothetical protein